MDGESNYGKANLADLLFDLSVNFLMYALLITVMYMMVRFYLEEDFEFDHANQRQYEMVNTSGEIESAAAGGSNVDGGLESIKESNDEGGFLPSLESLEGKIAETVGGTNKGLKRQASFLNLNEWGEPEGTKEEVIQRAIFCAAGLNVCFVFWGLLQERMLTQPYNGEYFVYSYGLVFLNRLGGLAMSGALVWYFKIEFVKSPLWEYSFPSVANMLSSWCQYEALKYVSFPTAMLAKAFKVVPVMLMGKFMHNKSYESYEYGSAATVMFGLYLFLDSAEHIDFKQNVFGEPETIKGAWCGVVLLLLFLAFDSFTGQWQARMFNIHKQMSPLQMMLVMNAFSTVFAFVTLVHQEEFRPTVEYAYEHSEFFIHLVLFVIFSTVGQIFIFYTVKNFGAVVFSIIMSIRILLSTVVSCFVYDHPITELGFVGMLLVFGSIVYRIRRKTEGKPIIRWKESIKTPSVEASEVFSHWHEHLDH
jgi:adenosine 3'-phospho 5'-phosphosulfate transporter B2